MFIPPHPLPHSPLVTTHSLLFPPVYSPFPSFYPSFSPFFPSSKDKRNQLLNEIRTLCDAPKAAGLVEFYGAFFSPDSGQISICLEYMDGGSLADIVRKKGQIPENILSLITRKVLQVKREGKKAFCFFLRFSKFIHIFHFVSFFFGGFGSFWGSFKGLYHRTLGNF